RQEWLATPVLPRGKRAPSNYLLRCLAIGGHLGRFVGEPTTAKESRPASPIIDAQDPELSHDRGRELHVRQATGGDQTLVTHGWRVDVRPMLRVLGNLLLEIAKPVARVAAPS